MTQKIITKDTLVLTGILLMIIFTFQPKNFRLVFILHKTRAEGRSVKDCLINKMNKNNYFFLLSECEKKQKHNYCPDKFIVYKDSLFRLHKLEVIEGEKIEFHRFNLKDINSDGQKDIIVSTDSGGNCFCCGKTEIYNIKNDKLIRLFASKFGCIKDILDLNNDGNDEVMLFDDRFEFYDGLCHGCSPGLVYVYEWKRDKYINVSSQYKNFYAKEIGRLIKNIESDLHHKRYLEDIHQGSYFGDTISLLLNFSTIGEKAKGINLFKKYVNPAFIKFENEIKSTALEIYNKPEEFLSKYSAPH